MLTERTLEDILVAEGYVTRDQLQEAQSQRTRASQPLADILVRMGAITERQRTECQAIAAGIPFVDVKDCNLEFARKLSQRTATRYRAVVVDASDSAASVAMVNPMDLEGIDQIGRELGLEVDPMWAVEQDVTEVLQDLFGSANSVQDLILEASRDLGESIEVKTDTDEEQESLPELRESAEGGPVVQLANALFAQAIALRASDIHVEPSKRAVRVRLRIDGVLQDIMEIPREVHRALVSRVKIISGLDIAERRAPQDGRCSMTTAEGEFDFRIATYPSVNGEKVCVRVLDKRRSNQDIRSLRIPEAPLNQLLMAAEASQGLIIVCGPTGSGKTTTLYSLLNHLNTPGRHIITVEDPVEYQLDGIIQGNVNKAAGLSFASGLRAMMRQDPDVILVGESRDPETAKTAIEASLTGHLVLTSLHANDSASAVVRLVEMGVESFLVGASVTCSVSQRLVRSNCPHCSAPYSPDPATLARLGLPTDAEYKAGTGCEKCANTGYRGRMGVYEVLSISPKLRLMITENRPAPELFAEAYRGGFESIQQDARNKVLAGLTTVEEILRVVAF